MRSFTYLSGEEPDESSDANPSEGGAEAAAIYAARPGWFGPPDDEIPVAVPMQRILARSPGAVLSLRRCDAYTTGIAIKLRIDLRFDRIEGWQPEPPPRGLFIPDHFSQHPRVELRFTAVLPDGTEVEANSRIGGPPSLETEGPLLLAHTGGGGGGEHSWNSALNLWLWPLPPEGTLRLRYACEDAGLAEGVLELDATALRRAAGEAIDLRD